MSRTAVILRHATIADVPAPRAVRADSFPPPSAISTARGPRAVPRRWRTEKAYRDALADPAKRIQLAESTARSRPTR
jgi:hypothetical protein